MAANYWSSTQRRFWFFSKDKLADIRKDHEEKDRSILQQHPIPDQRLIYIFLKDQLLRLSKRLLTRQQALATSLVYMHRYFLSNPIYSVNPYLVLSTAFYLASKTEECPHHIRLVLSEARQLWPEFIPGDVSRLGEMEFSLISEMRSQLIVWHPYRTLMDLKESSLLGLTTEEVGLAWSIINDSYMTDLPLTCPPHLIAFVAVFLAVVFQPDKSASGLHVLPQPPALVPNGTASFQSLGGRTGIAESLNNAMSNAKSAKVTNASGAHGSNESDGSNEVDSTKAESMVAALTSDKIQRMTSFLAESEIDLEQMIEATQEVISLYEIWEQYNEKTVREMLSRCLKGRGLDK